MSEAVRLAETHICWRSRSSRNLDNCRPLHPGEGTGRPTAEDGNSSERPGDRPEGDLPSEGSHGRPLEVASTPCGAARAGSGRPLPHCGGAGATPGSRAAGIIAGVVLAAGVRSAPGVAAVCGGLAEGSRVGRGAGGLGGVAPSGASAPAPEGLGSGPVAVGGVARVAGTGGVRSPRGVILAGWSG